MRKAAKAQPQGDGALSALLETERRIADRLAAAKREAARIVADARLRAEADEHSAADAIEGEMARLAETHQSSLRDELARIEATAAREAAAFDAIDGSRIDALAEWVVERVLAP